jgi:hypothetical protein
MTKKREQLLVPGVVPVTLRVRLERLLRAPLRPSKPHKPLNICLRKRDQLDFFGPTRRTITYGGWFGVPLRRPLMRRRSC